jgi:hypothetical protein
MNFGEKIFLFFNNIDSLKILKKNSKFAEEKETHEESDYKDIFIQISKNFKAEVKVNK